MVQHEDNKPLRCRMQHSNPQHGGVPGTGSAAFQSLHVANTQSFKQTDSRKAMASDKGQVAAVRDGGGCI